MNGMNAAFGARARAGPADPVRLRAAETRIAAIARLLDGLVEIPGTRRRIGLDAVVGLIPGVGDFVTAAIGAWIVLEAARLRLPRIVIARMVVNTLVDLALGAIPVIGDLFDVVFTSNTANLALFRRHAADPAASTTGERAFFAGLALLAVGTVWLVAALLGRLLAIEIPAP